MSYGFDYDWRGAGPGRLGGLYRLQKEYISNKVDDDIMSEANKALVQKIYDRIWNQGEISAVDELFDAEYNDHIIEGTPGTSPGP